MASASSVGQSGADASTGLGAQEETDDPVDFDGFSESWFADQARFEAAMMTAPWRDLVEDGGEVFDLAFLRGMSAVLDERVMIP